MAVRKLCLAPGCDELAELGTNRCADHTAARKVVVAAAKASAKLGHVARIGADLYNGKSWRKASKSWLARHPLCVECESLGVVTAAREVDHITPHRGDLVLFWSRSNWQSLCKSCHSRKTAREVFHQRIPPGGR